MPLLLCDSNVWLALALPGHPHQVAAQAWLSSIEAKASIAFCRATQQSFLRLLTTPAVWREAARGPLSNREAWETYEALLDDDRIVFIDTEPHGIELAWKGLSSRESASCQLWMDPYLAAFAISAQSQFITFDGAFRQFTGLNVLILES